MSKIVFMGTPDFAVPSLETLVERGHEVGIVVTKPDAKRDRGKKISFSEVKQKALELSLRVLQPEKIKGNEEFISELRSYAPDYIVTAAYGKILPADVLNIPSKGCLNVHGSLLPRHRGAAPIQWSILEGDENGGVSIMYMAEKMDAGDVLARAAVRIDKKNCEELHDELALKGAELLADTIDEIEKGNAKAEPQDESLVTYAPMISKKDGDIDFTKKASSIERRVRAFYPWPGAYTRYKGELLKIWEADAADGEDTRGAVPGTVLDVSDEGIDIACGKGVLTAKTIQIPGKKKMKVSDFLRGNSIEKSSKLG